MRIGLSVLVLAATPALAEDRPPPTAWFTQEPAEVANLLANKCVDRSGAVVEQDAFHVLCVRQMSGSQGILAQALLGNAYSTTPEVRLRFAVMKDGAATRVQASQWVEVQMALGQVRRTEMNGKKQNASLVALLTEAGGSALRVQRPAAPLATPAP